MSRKKVSRKKGGRGAVKTPVKTLVVVAAAAASNTFKSSAPHLAYNKAYKAEEARQKVAGEEEDKEAMSYAGKMARMTMH